MCFGRNFGSAENSAFLGELVSVSAFWLTFCFVCPLTEMPNIDNFGCWSQCAVQTRCWEYLGKKSTYCPSIPHELSMNSPFPHFLAVFPSLSPTNCHQHHILSLVAPHQNLSNPLFVNVILTKRFWECNSGNLCGENIDANLGLLMDLYDGC